MLPVLHWCVRQLRAPLQQNPQRICTNKHFTALSGIHIFAGIENCAVGGYMVSASRPFLASVILPAWLGLLSLLSQEGGRIQVHPTGFALERVQISGWQLRSRHILFMVNTKDLYSAYCPTGGCTHHPSLCLRLSTARLLHSHVCPSKHIVTLLGTSCDFVCHCQAPCPSRYFGAVCADQKLTHQGAFARDISSSSILVEVKRMQSE